MTVTHWHIVMPYGDTNLSTLTRVMACFLTEPNHYLNQCWLMIGKGKWRLSEGNLTWWPQPSITKFSLKLLYWNYIQISQRRLRDLTRSWGPWFPHETLLTCSASYRMTQRWSGLALVAHSTQATPHGNLPLPCIVRDVVWYCVKYSSLNPGGGGGGGTPSLRSLRVSRDAPRFCPPFSASGRSFCPPKFDHVYHFIQILLGPISKPPIFSM